MPRPVSMMRTVTSSTRGSTVRVMRPPGDVYRAALFSRFANAWESLTASPWIGMGLSGIVTESLCACESISGLLVSRAPAHHVAKIDLFLDDRELTAGDAVHVEQVVDDPRKRRDLPIDGIAHRFQRPIAHAAFAHELDGVANRRERIAQLVREHRDELVHALRGFC